MSDGGLPRNTLPDPRTLVPDRYHQLEVAHARAVDENRASAHTVVIPDPVRTNVEVERALYIIRLAEQHHHIAAIGAPSIPQVCVPLVGRIDPVVVLLHPLVAFGTGRGVTFIPKLLETCESFLARPGVADMTDLALFRDILELFDGLIEVANMFVEAAPSYGYDSLSGVDQPAVRVEQLESNDVIARLQVGHRDVDQ